MCYWVVDMEIIIYIRIGVGVGDIQWYKYGDGFVEMFFGIFFVQLCYWFQVFCCCGGDECYKVVYIVMFFVKSVEYIIFGFGVDGFGGFFLIYFFKFF